MRKKVYLTSVFLLVFFIILGIPIRAEGNIEVTILYDNYVKSAGVKSDWGFACMIQGAEKTILFDTGTNGEILLHNFRILKKNPKDADVIVISHNHGDHMGGLLTILEKNPRVTIFFPPSIPSEYMSKIKQKKVPFELVNKPQKICDNVFTTGKTGQSIIEQALILDTSEGLVIITGCSHPGIVSMIRVAKEFMNKKVYMVFGGFHLLQKSESELKEIIRQFKQIGVKKVGATHCTGDQAIRMFKDEFKEDFIDMGVGKVLKFTI